MRCVLGLVVALAGCLKPSAHQCSAGWTCPGGLDCVQAPTFCAAHDEATVCGSAADFSTCSTAMVPAGYCQGGACQPCLVDEAACAVATWQPMTYVGPDLASVFVRAPDSAIAVGAGSVAEWDGHAWTASDAAATDALRSVWVPPEGGAAWIVSTSKIYRWDGTTLATVNTPAMGMITAVWASSQSDIYAVGGGATIIHDVAGVFSETSLVTNTRTLQAVGGSAAGEVYVVGTAATVAHLEGGAWAMKTMPTDVGNTNLRGVWSDAANDVYVVGAASTILHFDGTAWTHSPAAADVTAGNWNLHAVWGAGPSDVYAVGSDPGGATGVIVHFDGQMWTTMATPAVPLASVSGAGMHEVIAVGGNHTVLRYTGKP